jgi:hypothetical protein
MVMNERIQELADKIWAEEYWDNPNTDKLLPAQLNKFAKLIIEECCDVVRYIDAVDIKKHFGVEQ